MIFFLNLDGTCTRMDTDHIYQGSNNVSKVIAVTNISPVQTFVQVAFTLPNGLVYGYFPTRYNQATYKGAYQVGDDVDNLMHLWEFDMPYNVTEAQGTVGISFNVVNSLTGNNKTSYTNTFEVEYSALPVPPTSASETELEEILRLLNAYYAQNTGIIATHTSQITAIQVEQQAQNNQISELQQQSANLQKSVQQNTSDIKTIKVEQAVQNVDIFALKTKDTDLQGQISANTAMLARQGQQIANHENEITSLQNSVLTGETYVGTLPSSATLPTIMQIQQYYTSNVGRQPRLNDVLFFTQTLQSGYKVYKYFYTATGWSNYEIPGANTGSNPNFVINSNFVINQRGQTNYTGANHYTVDHWRLSYGTLNVLETGGISHTSSNTWQGVVQYIEKPSELSGKTVTFSANCNVLAGGILHIYVFLRRQNAANRITICTANTQSVTPAIISATGIIPNDVTDNDQIYVMLYNSLANKTFYAYWAKLEIGEVPTQYTPPLIAEELPKCQRFYQLRTNSYAFPISALDRTPVMRENGTIGTTTINGTLYKYCDAEI